MSLDELDPSVAATVEAELDIPGVMASGSVGRDRAQLRLMTGLELAPGPISAV